MKSLKNLFFICLFLFSGIFPVYGTENIGVFEQVLQDFFTRPPDLTNLELSFSDYKYVVDVSSEKTQYEIRTYTDRLNIKFNKINLREMKWDCDIFELIGPKLYVKEKILKPYNNVVVGSTPPAILQASLPEDWSATPEIKIKKFIIERGEFHYENLGDKSSPVIISDLLVEIKDLMIPAEPGKEMAIHFAATINSATPGKLEIGGFIYPATKGFYLDASGQNIDFGYLNPLLSKSKDNKIKKGILDFSVSASCVNGQFVSNNSMILRDFEIKSEDKTGWDFLNKTASTAVLNLIKDGKEGVALDFIVQGDFYNPKFDLGDAYGKAISSAAKQKARGKIVRKLSTDSPVANRMKALGGGVKSIFGIKKK